MIKSTMGFEIMVNPHESALKNKKKKTESGIVPDIHCKLFSDVVTKHVCALRRQELNKRGSFSCDGCRWDKETWNSCS